MSDTTTTKPWKAYEVTRITRGVTTALVYAHNAEDAKRRYLGGQHERADTEHYGRGWGPIRRAPDRDVPQPVHSEGYPEAP